MQQKMFQLFFIFINILLLNGCTTLSKHSINSDSGALSQVVLTVSNISNSKGNLIVFIHDNEYSYYGDENSNDPSLTPFRMRIIPAQMPSARLVFDDIPQGKYAFSAYHDEDGDGELDRMIFPFIGMPSESYALSNDAFAYFSKGSFEQAQIEIKAPQAQVSIKLLTHLRKTLGG